MHAGFALRAAGRLTVAPRPGICLPLVAGRSVTAAGVGQRGAVGVLALDKTQLKVLLGSQSATVKIEQMLITLSLLSCTNH